ncbi:MAG: hypothetical protein KKF62_07230 [Bacteroidetes bacterium]|nr:hypothetical protein [Bacteroidota bacterium]MBU1114136.1 hypothetical protein [Bacteroidota bacterium]MBU1796802.1 hypothetical protein [Bacteroidota bacterium]
MKDMGKLTGIYFFIIGIIQVAVHLIYNGSLYLELSPILIGYFLYTHNAKARDFVSVILGIVISANILIIIYVAIVGTKQSLGFNYFGFKLESNIILWSVFSIVILAIPFSLLRTKKAIIEFEGEVLST